MQATARFEGVPSRSLEVLVRMIECVAGRGNLLEVSRELARQLHELIDFEFLHLSLYDPERNVMRRFVVEGRDDDVQVSLPTDVPMHESLAATVMESQQARIWDDISLEQTCWQVVEYLRQKGVSSYCLLPLTTPQERLGAIGFGQRRSCVYRERDLEWLRTIVSVMAIAVENVLQHEKTQAYEAQLTNERDHSRTLLEITTQLVSQLELSELFSAISGSLRRIMHHDFACLNLIEDDGNQVRLHSMDFPESHGVFRTDMVAPISGTVTERALQAGAPIICGRLEDIGLDPRVVERFAAERLKSLCALPLINRGRRLGCLILGSLQGAHFRESEYDFLKQIGNQVAVAVDNAITFQQVQRLKEKLEEEKLYLEDEIGTEYNFGEIIGESRALKEILKTVETVAPTDATVLIQGETGTGKELLARAIHNLSKRKERTFVKLNCAAIPTGLLESELFGHEKGAFTGAISQKIGRLELADKGTLFLDEVGDIPPEIQPKLLRVLQEQEFERLGSTRTIRVDVRLIAATNRDLPKMVETHEFRQDLYYRLRVVPISVPPLRERRDDIDRLVRYFTQKYSRRMGKRFKSIPEAAMKALVSWQWPGNIRELENVIERAVILSPGPALQVPIEEFRSTIEEETSTLASAERQHILKVLRECGGVIGGDQGAAVRLGMKRSTLQARMKKLGISRSDFQQA